MTKQTDNPHSYSSTHVELPKEMADRIKAIGATIPPEDLAEDGLETNPHITCKYGLNSDSPAAVKSALKGEMPARFRLGQTDVFPATADRPSDVLVARVHGEDLHRLHHLVSGSAPHVDTHAGYTPHATIAYLKPGMGQKYANRSDLAGMEGVADEVVHSSKGGEETRIPLAGKVRHATNRMMLSASAIILDAAPLGPAKAVPLGLTGQPTFAEVPGEEIGKNPDGSPIFETKRVPIQYLKKEVARAGEWTHRGNGGKFQLAADKLKQAVANYRERAKAGILPFIPDSHVESRDAARNNGDVIDLALDGDKLYATMKLVGTEAIEKTLKNDVSVYLVDGSDELVTDAYGKKYDGYVLHHVALTPNPALPHLGPFQRIAASADAPARDVPVYDYAGITPPTKTPSTAAPRRKGSHMDPVIASKARAAFSLSADAVPDDKLDDAVAEKALALSADAITLAAERDALKASVATLTGERDEAKAKADAEGKKVLALSAEDPTNLSPANRGAYEMNADALWELSVKNGGLASVDAVKFKALVRNKDGTPGRLALSASGDNGHPFEWNLARLFAGLATPIRTGTVKPGDVTEAQRLALDAGGADGADKPNDADVAYLRKLNNIPAPAK